MTQEPIRCGGISAWPALECLITATMRERKEAIMGVALDHYVSPELLLMCLGAISLLSTDGSAEIPESVLKWLQQAAIVRFDILHPKGHDRDPMEGLHEVR